MSTSSGRPRARKARRPAVPVTLLNDQGALPIDRRRIRRLVRSTLRGEGRADAAVTLLVTGDRRIADLCTRFLGRARRTDVLAFPDPEGGALGEVVVNAERAVREARRRRIDPTAELCLYVVHGLLHLAGYDDQTPADARRMHAREATVLRRFGYASVYDAPVRRAARSTGVI